MFEKLILTVPIIVCSSDAFNLELFAKNQLSMWDYWEFV